MTYLANHVHGFFDTIDADGSGDINFEVRCAPQGGFSKSLACVDTRALMLG
jgi:hypothetical protein